MIKLVLTFLAILALLGFHFEKKRKGDFDHPVIVPERCLLQIQTLSQEMQKVEVKLMAMARQQESVEVLCFPINNSSDYTLTEIECEIRNDTRDLKDTFTIWPVTGDWIPRNGFRKYFSKPKGIQKWTGNFGDRVNLKDRLHIKILKAYGFRT